MELKQLGVKMHITNATVAIIEMVRLKIINMLGDAQVILQSAEPYWKIPEETVCIFRIYLKKPMSVADFTRLFKNTEWLYTKVNVFDSAVWSKFARNDMSLLDESIEWVHVYDYCE